MLPAADVAVAINELLAAGLVQTVPTGEPDGFWPILRGAGTDEGKLVVFIDPEDGSDDDEE